MIAKKIDWFGCSFSDSDIFGVLDFMVKGFPHRSGKSRFYSHGLIGEGISLFSCPRNERLHPFLFEASGKGCSNLGGDALFSLLRGRVQIFRLDVAWDFLSGIGSVEPIIYPDSLQCLRDQHVTLYEVDGCYSGFSSGKADFRLRYYDKAREQGAHDYIEEWEWWRLEVAVRGDLCKAQDWNRADAVDGDDPYSIALGLLRRRFGHPVFDLLGDAGTAQPAPRSRPVEESVRLHRAAERARKTLQRLAADGVDVKKIIEEVAQ